MKLMGRSGVVVVLSKPPTQSYVYHFRYVKKEAIRGIMRITKISKYHVFLRNSGYKVNHFSSILNLKNLY